MGLGVHAGKHMDGQQTFSSGWEWSYWLNDVVTARAAWNPHLEAASDDDALGAILDSALRPFGDARRAIRDLVIETAREERELLIEGRVSGAGAWPAGPASTVRKNGQAYLQGFETWDDLISRVNLLASAPGADRPVPNRSWRPSMLCSPTALLP